MHDQFYVALDAVANFMREWKDYRAPHAYRSTPSRLHWPRSSRVRKALNFRP